MTSPLATCCPGATMGLWLKQVSWLVRWNLIIRYSSGSSPSARSGLMMIFSELT